ncbi:hypothetical protein BDA99DRAFT_313897 [Phascolomyces articulosus]|uniref:Uncharacterized protein n=1 Tax=Phascolomyces articulosus TaxID=60185 RepID=A0AAD5JVI7_9FUNG|nr:hypothetical protein BDA99DRAFT_313897 [Phascolomyces articulosus]
MNRFSHTDPFAKQNHFNDIFKDNDRQQQQVQIQKEQKILVTDNAPCNLDSNAVQPSGHGSQVEKLPLIPLDPQASWRVNSYLFDNMVHNLNLQEKQQPTHAEEPISWYFDSAGFPPSILKNKSRHDKKRRRMAQQQQQRETSESDTMSSSACAFDPKLKDIQDNHLDTLGLQQHHLDTPRLLNRNVSQEKCPLSSLKREEIQKTSSSNVSIGNKRKLEDMEEDTVKILSFIMSPKIYRLVWHPDRDG